MSPIFSPPAFVDDLDDIHRRAWNDFLVEAFKDAKSYVETSVGAGKSQFFTPAEVTPTDPRNAEVFWDAFPRGLRVLHGEDGAFEKAEPLATWGVPDYLGRDEGSYFDSAGRALALKYRQQDEYCEWLADTDRRTGKIVRVTFTCEGPEYWETLAMGYPRYYPGPRDEAAKGMKDKLLSLYQSFYGDRVRIEDLFFPQDVYQLTRHGLRRAFHEGDYNPYNRWNTDEGVVHLTHRANTLFAEIYLAAQATILRGEQGKLLEDADRLVCCAGYGEPTRASDPTIGSEVNRAARSGAFVSLANPVGLYIHKLDDSSFTLPNGQAVGKFWRFTRGQEGMGLRLVYEVPPNPDGLVVGDLLIDGEPVRYGGQIAAHIKIKLVAQTFGAATQNAPVSCPFSCCRQKGNLNHLRLKEADQRCPDGYEDAFQGPVGSDVAEGIFLGGPAVPDVDASDFLRRRGAGAL